LAAGDLTTVEKVRSYLKLPDLEDDEWLTELVTQASQEVKTALGRDILAADYTHAFDGDDEQEIVLRQYPVQTVTSVSVDGTAVPARTVVSEGGWVLSGDAVHLVGYRFTRGTQNVVVVYRAGYAAVPDDLERAVILQAALAYSDRDRFGKQSVNLNGESVSFNGGLVKSVIDGILDRYRRVVV
jgi:uncharacterized phiE125 gp8 family phage protein